MNPIILIPARMAASRLPGKPLADINGKPMIMHVYERARASQLGRVVVAAGDPEIVAVVQAAGGEAVQTDPNLPRGSDRIWAALNQLQAAEQHDVIINVQGDLPSIEPAAIGRCAALLTNRDIAISTLVTSFKADENPANTNQVKAIVEMDTATAQGRCLYFTRSLAPWQNPNGSNLPYYHHIGLYAYQRAALAAFTAAPQSVLECQENLEQLRALALGMRIEAAMVASAPPGVDTPADLELMRKILRG